MDLVGDEDEDEDDEEEENERVFVKRGSIIDLISPDPLSPKTNNFDQTQKFNVKNLEHINIPPDDPNDNPISPPSRTITSTSSSRAFRRRLRLHF